MSHGCQLHQLLIHIREAMDFLRHAVRNPFPFLLRQLPFQQSRIPQQGGQRGAHLVGQGFQQSLPGLALLTQPCLPGFYGSLHLGERPGQGADLVLLAGWQWNRGIALRRHGPGGFREFLERAGQDTGQNQRKQNQQGRCSTRHGKGHPAEGIFQGVNVPDIPQENHGQIAVHRLCHRITLRPAAGVQHGHPLAADQAVVIPVGQQRICNRIAPPAEDQVDALRMVVLRVLPCICHSLQIGQALHGLLHVPEDNALGGLNAVLLTLQGEGEAALAHEPGDAEEQGNGDQQDQRDQSFPHAAPLCQR